MSTVSVLHGCSNIPCFYSVVGKTIFFIVDDFGNAVRLTNDMFYHRMMANESNPATYWSL